MWPRPYPSLPWGPILFTRPGEVPGFVVGVLVPNTRPTANSGGLPQPFPSQTFVSSSLKMGVTRLTCLAGVRVNYCLWSSFESRR